MILLQLSAAKGPAECALAVAKAMNVLEVEAKQLEVDLKLLQSQPGERSGTFKSLLYALQGKNALQLAQQWSGSMCWACPSPYRPGHKRKNWFFGARWFVIDNPVASNEVTFQTCRASGSGGQHVNTTDSAVRATHVQSGLSVRVESERSQHANKKLALVLLRRKLDEQGEALEAANERERHQHHQQIERGNITRHFKGPQFKPQ